MKKWSVVVLLLVGATFLGATVLREPIASAAQGINATIIGPLDAGGNVKVHEQGTANVNVTNSAVPVHEQGSVTVAVSPNANTVRSEPHLTDRFGVGVTLVLNNVGEPERDFDFTVPAGKVFVVEHVSAQVEMQEAGLSRLLVVYAMKPGSNSELRLNLQHESTFGSASTYGYDSDVTLAIWPGPNNHIHYHGPPGLAHVFLTGYLVDAP